MPDYSLLDHPSLLRYLFYPRRDFREGPANSFDLEVKSEDNVMISARFYSADRASPSILYFHGNGEVVSDYDDLSPFFNMAGFNLVVADYRGYGASGGTPTFAGLIRDSHAVYSEVKNQLQQRGFRLDLWLMGRSMGSFPALELAYHYPGEIKGLIIESGFLSPVRLIKNFGLPAPDEIDDLEAADREKVGGIKLPVLIIHGEYDTLVPLPEAEYLYHCLGSDQKSLCVIPRADHNNIMFVGLEQYFNAIQRFIRG